MSIPGEQGTESKSANILLTELWHNSCC